jgi:hypothetical protein
MSESGVSVSSAKQKRGPGAGKKKAPGGSTTTPNARPSTFQIRNAAHPAFSGSSPLLPAGVSSRDAAGLGTAALGEVANCTCGDLPMPMRVLLLLYLVLDLILQIV